MLYFNFELRMSVDDLISYSKKGDAATVATLLEQNPDLINKKDGVRILNVDMCLFVCV